MKNIRDRRRMRDAVKYLQGYVESYERQAEFDGCRLGTLLDDVLYGLGVALDREQYYGANGFDRFKDFLREHLGPASSATAEQPK